MRRGWGWLAEDYISSDHALTARMKGEGFAYIMRIFGLHFKLLHRDRALHTR